MTLVQERDERQRRTRRPSFVPTAFPTVAALSAPSPPSPSGASSDESDESVEPQQSSTPTTGRRGSGGRPRRQISLTEQGQLLNDLPSMTETVHNSMSSAENSQTVHNSISSAENTAPFYKLKSSGSEHSTTNSIKFQHADLYGSPDDICNFDSNQGLAVTVSTAPISFAEKPAIRNSDGVSVSTNGSMYSEKWNSGSANTSAANSIADEESAAINAARDGVVQEESHQSETTLDDLHQKSGEPQALMNGDSNEALDHALASKREPTESSAATAISTVVRHFIGSAAGRAQNAITNQTPNAVKESDEAERSQCSQSTDSGESDVVQRAVNLLDPLRGLLGSGSMSGQQIGEENESREPLEEVQKECKTSLIERTESTTSSPEPPSSLPRSPATDDNTPAEQAEDDLTRATESLRGPDGATKEGDDSGPFISAAHALTELATNELNDTTISDSSSSDSVSISRTRPSLVSDFKETVKRESFQKRMTSPKGQAAEAVVDWPSPVSSIGSPVLKERKQRTSEITVDSKSLPPLPLHDRDDDPSSASDDEKSWPTMKSRQRSDKKDGSDDSLDPSGLREKSSEDSNDQSKLSSSIVWPSSGPSNANFRDALKKTASSSRILKGLRSSAQREANLHSSLRSFNSGHRNAHNQNRRACRSEDCVFETSGQPSSTLGPLMSPVASESEKSPDKLPQDNAGTGDIEVPLDQDTNNPLLVSIEHFDDDEEANEEYYTPSPLHEVPSASNDGESVVSSLDSLASPVHPSNNNVSRMHRQHQRRDSDSSCSTLSLASPTQALTQSGKTRTIGSKKSSMKSMDMSDRAIISSSWRPSSAKSRKQSKTDKSRPGAADVLEESERSSLSQGDAFNESEHTGTKSDASQNYPPKVKCLADGLPRRAMERRSSDRSLTNSSCYSRATMQSLQSEISNLQPSGLADDVALHLEHSMMSMNTYQSSDGIDDIDPACTTSESKVDFDFAMNLYIKAMNHGHFDFGLSAIGEDNAWEGDDGMLAARAYMGLGYTRQYKGELESSMQAYSKAINLIEEELGVDHPITAPVHYAMGVVMIGMTMQLDASDHFTTALKLYKTMLSGDSNADVTVRANIFSTEGMLFDVLGEQNRAIDCFRQTVVVCQSLGQPSLKFADVMFELGSLLSQRGEYGESAYCFNFALQIRKNLLGDSFLVARTHYSLGVTQATLELGGNLPSGMAAGHLQEALRICSEQFEEEHLQFAIIVHALGVLNERNGDFLAASVWFAKERDIRKQVLGDDHESLSAISSDLGTCYFNSGKYDLAISTFADALRIILLTESRESLEVADALYKIASCHDSLCNYDAALEQFHEVKQLRETLFGIESGPVIQTMLRIGNILLGIGRIEMAQECFSEILGIGYASDNVNAVEVANALYGRGCAQFCGFRLADAMKSFNESLNWKLAALGEDDPGLACIFYQMAHVYLEQSEQDEAITCFEEYARLQKLDPQRNLHENADICYAEGIVAKLKGLQDAALSFFKQALAMFGTLFGGEHEKVASIHFDIGCVCNSMGDNETALTHFQTCLLQRQKLLGGHGGHVDVANVLYEMASTYQLLGHTEIAGRCLMEADKIWKSKLDNNEKLTAVLLLSANLWKSLQHYKEAEENYEEALKDAIRLHGQKHDLVASILLSLGELLQEINQIPQALFCFDESIEVRTALHGPDSPSVAQVEYSKGVAYLFQQDFENAFNCLERSLTIRREKLGAMDGTVGDTFNTIGFLQLRMGNISDDTLATFYDALEIRRAVGNQSKVVSTLMNIASVHKKRKDFDSCMNVYADILAARQEEFGLTHSQVADAWMSLGNIQTTAGRIEEATISYGEALRIRTMNDGYNHISVARILFKIGSLNSRQQNYTDAKQLFEEYMRIRAEEEDDPDQEMAEALTLMGDLQKETGEKSKAHINWMSALEIYEQLGYPDDHPKLRKLKARQRAVPGFALTSRASYSNRSISDLSTVISWFGNNKSR